MLSIAKASLIASSWTREGLVEMRKLSLYHSVGELILLNSRGILDVQSRNEDVKRVES